MDEISGQIMHMDIMLDIYDAAFDIIFKHNLTNALMKTSQIVTRKSWIENIQSDKRSNVTRAIGRAISPLTEQIFEMPGTLMAKSLPSSL
jgi:hypothetical protein